VSFSQEVAPGDEQSVAEYFAHVYADFPDILTTLDMAAMTGLHPKSFHRIIKAGHIKFLAKSPKYIVPKVYFLDFVASDRFIEAWSCTEEFTKILGGFKEWKATR